MLKVYNYIFYRSYDLLALTGNYDVAWGGIYFLSTVEALVIILMGHDFADMFRKPYGKPVAVFAFIIPMAINFWFFLGKERYKNIVAKYADETRAIKIIGRSGVVLVFVSLIFWIFNR